MTKNTTKIAKPPFTMNKDVRQKVLRISIRVGGISLALSILSTLFAIFVHMMIGKIVLFFSFVTFSFTAIFFAVGYIDPIFSQKTYMYLVTPKRLEQMKKSKYWVWLLDLKGDENHSSLYSQNIDTPSKTD